MSEHIDKKDVLDQFIDHTALYSIEANRKRSVPDVKDGLKRVHRRILYSMYNEVHAVDRPVKTARVVGDVIGKFHPHGDCLRANTKIYLLNGGITTIGELYEYGIEAFESLGINKDTMKVEPILAHSLRIGQYTNEIYHIRFSNGVELECTSNHPILMKNGEYVKAEDVRVGMAIYSNCISFCNGRPRISGNGQIQDIVYNYFYGKVPEGYVKHHKNHRTTNNCIGNFETITRRDHAIHHKDYVDGLQKGRETMLDTSNPKSFNNNIKNKMLMSMFNKDQNFRRFKLAINTLKNRGLAVTYENYETLRPEIYNLPKIESLIEKWYGSTFEELVNNEIPTVGEMYANYKANLIPLVEEIIGENYHPESLYKYRTFVNIQNMIFESSNYVDYDFLNINYNEYISRYGNWKDIIDEESFNDYLGECLLSWPVVVDVTVEKVNEEPMFDFTVDTTSNMIIPIPGYPNIEMNNIPFICVHNSSVEDAIKPLCNWFECKVPLLSSKSNMGTMQGNSASASRYTEIKLSEFCKECVIAEMRNTKDVVDWVPNFDNTEMEPEYFPVIVPLALINGTFGLGIGMMTEIPKHNLVEVIDATINLIKNPKAPVVLVPDHCMPCEIIDTNWKSICNKGNGKYIVRGVIDIEKDKKNNGCYCLVIKSVPDRVFYDRGNDRAGGVHYKILDMIKEGKLPQIAKIEEDSDGNNMRIVIRLKKGADPVYVKELLYKTTQLQDTYTVNFEVLDGFNPVRLSYKAYLEYFIEQRKLTKFRYNCIMLQKVRTEFHKREAYVKVLESGYIDKIIDMIKRQSTTDDSVVVEYIVKHAKITDIQAKFIINSNIKKLSKAYLNKYKEEMNKYAADDKFYENKITHEELILNDIIEELQYVKKKYGEPRKCRVISKDEINSIPSGEFNVVITENNYIKKLSPKDPIGAYRGDNPKHIIRVDNRENIILFSSQGKVFKLPVHKIPLTERGSVGLDIRIVLKGLISDITTMIYEPTLKEVSKLLNKHYLTVVTNNNCIKKLDIEDFLNVPPSGIIYTKLNPNDYVKDVLLVSDSLDIVIYSDRKALRINMKDIPKYKRSTLGVSAMNLSDNQCIDGISVVYPDVTDIIVITESGYINKFDITGLQVSNRYKSGSSVIKLKKTDKIHSIFGVNDKNVINIITTNNKLSIPVSEIPKGSSLSSGVRKLQSKNEAIVKCSITK